MAQSERLPADFREMYARGRMQKADEKFSEADMRAVVELERLRKALESDDFEVARFAVQKIEELIDVMEFWQTQSLEWSEKICRYKEEAVN